MVILRLAPPALVAVLVAGCASGDALPPAGDGSLAAATLGRLDLDGAAARSVDLRGALAAVGCGADGVFLVDVSRPDAPEVLARLPDVPADVVEIGGDLLLALGTPGGFTWTFGAPAAQLTAVDLIDPREPGARRVLDLGGAASAMAVEGATVAVGGERLLILDAHVFKPVDHGAVLGGATADAVLLRRGVVHVHTVEDELDFGLGYGETLGAFLQVSAADGTLLARHDQGEVPPGGLDSTSLELVGERLIATTGAGLLCFDVTAPDLLLLQTALDLPGAAAIRVDGGVAAVANGDVALLRLDDPLQPALALLVPTAGEARDVALQGDLLAVADGDEGLLLLQVGEGLAPARPENAPDDAPAAPDPGP